MTKLSPKRAIYPGSFDPFTKGHQDILERSLQVFEEVWLVVAETPRKQSFFSVEERVEMLKKLYVHEPRVKVDHWAGLTMDYARNHGISVMIRGLRAASDFEYEFMMASMNKSLNPTVETFFMMTAQHLYFVSSTMIKELARFSDAIGAYVDPLIQERILKRMKDEHKQHLGKENASHDV